MVVVLLCIAAVILCFLLFGLGKNVFGFIADFLARPAYRFLICAILVILGIYLIVQMFQDFSSAKLIGVIVIGFLVWLLARAGNKK